MPATYSPAPPSGNCAGRLQPRFRPCGLKIAAQPAPADNASVIIAATNAGAEKSPASIISPAKIASDAAKPRRDSARTICQASAMRRPFLPSSRAQPSAPPLSERILVTSGGGKSSGRWNNCDASGSVRVGSCGPYCRDIDSCSWGSCDTGSCEMAMSASMHRSLWPVFDFDQGLRSARRYSNHINIRAHHDEPAAG